MTLEELAQRAEDRGWWLQYQSPFDRGHEHFIGLTKLGCSGWNGHPDLERHAPSLVEAVERGGSQPASRALRLAALGS